MNQQSSTTANDLTVFVNTSDSFEDCWEPFFKLFKLYWPDCPYPIVLNTETKEYQYEGLNISCSKVSLGELKPLGWSECLMRALDGIETPYILYLQEDYFLEASVRKDLFSILLSELHSADIGAIRLLSTDAIGPFYPTNSAFTLEIDKKAKWRLSLQAGLWKKTVLRSLVRKHETPWQLESYGSYRTRRLKEKIFSVNPVEISKKGSEVFPYTPTGIVAGKWVKDIVVPLFKKHKIELDFSIRGFHLYGARKKKRKAFLRRVIDRVRSFF